MRLSKKVLLVSLALVLVAGMVFAGGGKDAPAAAKGGDAPLEVWSFTDELEGMINNYYLKDFPNKKINYSLTPTEQFPNKLDPVLASGSGAPDVFALEDAFVRKYIESGLLLDLTDVYNEVKDKVQQYPVQVGTYNGKVYGLSWQVTPGAMFYRRSLAKKYLGTDDPAEVQKYFTDLNKFLDTAELLKTKSDGKCVVVSAIDDLQFPYLYGRKDPWVVNDKLVVDPKMVEYMQMAKTLKDKGFEGRASQWGEGWFAGMNGTLKDERGNAVEVFSYFLPTWGLHYVLKTNAPETSGDWAMIAGPISYRWGGTWIGAYKGTKNPEAAKELIKYIATDDDFLTRYALDSGDVVSNINVTNTVKDTFSEPFLGGQNHYAQFVEMAKNVDGRLSQATDDVIQGIFGEAVTAYVNGEKSLDAALADFKQQVNSQLGF